MLRTDLSQRIDLRQPPKTGGILAALRRSPLVEADIGLDRAETPGHDTGVHWLNPLTGAD